MAIQQRVLVPLAEGFEEIEAVAIVDVLRRAGLEVVLAALRPGRVKGAHGIEITPDVELGALDPLRFDAIVLPGGMPGTTNLLEDSRVVSAIRSLHAQGRVTAAVCAAPMVLAKAGVLAGRPATAHASVRDRLGTADVRPSQRVVRSDRVFTSQGPGTSIEFALEVAAELVGREKADQLARAMVVGSQ